MHSYTFEEPMDFIRIVRAFFILRFTKTALTLCIPIAGSWTNLNNLNDELSHECYKFQV